MEQDRSSMAVLFADMSDSTKLYESLGDTLAFGRVRECVGMLREISGEFDGRVVKTIGDGLMCAFATADLAAEAAAEMHRRIAEHTPVHKGDAATIRIGFHFGPVIVAGTDVFGDSVNVAARMAGLAIAGQALTTAETVAAMSPHLRELTRELEALRVKGKELEIVVHEVLWESSSDRTLMPGRAAPLAAQAGRPALVLEYGGRQVVISGDATLGRDAENTIRVADPLASRRHARIEVRGGKFVLIDQSSNGTYVTLGGGTEIRLRREEMILHGAGVIAFGHSAAKTGAEVASFHCEFR